MDNNSDEHLLVVQATIVSTLLFHKYGEVDVAFTNVMSHSSMFVPTKATVKLASGNTGHAQ